MLKFFRKIRQKLLSENKFSRYLIYALGEIVLVVIGILIALQINNWNEAKKDRSFEVKMLKEIKKALDNDIRDFESLVNRMDLLDSVTTDMARKIDKRLTDPTLVTESSEFNLKQLYTGIQYQYNRGPYDALKASGIDKISNDSLRNALIKLYDFTFPRNKGITEWADRDYKAHVKKVQSFLGNTTIVSENGEVKFEKSLNHEYVIDQEFINLLAEINSRSKRVRSSLRYMVTKMEELKDHILAETREK